MEDMLKYNEVVHTHVLKLNDVCKRKVTYLRKTTQPTTSWTIHDIFNSMLAFVRVKFKTLNVHIFIKTYGTYCWVCNGAHEKSKNHFRPRNWTRYTSHSSAVLQCTDCPRICISVKSISSLSSALNHFFVSSIIRE